MGRTPGDVPSLTDPGCHTVRTRSSLTVGDLARHLGAPLVGDPSVGDAVVLDITDDSRTVAPGHAYLAVGGLRHHGLDFDSQAAAAGAVVVISDRPSSVLPTLVVDDPRAVSGPLSSWFHGCPSARLRVFGVTGTNGKTSTSHFLEAGLAAAGETTAPSAARRRPSPTW
ncbi:Mur ligase domain-containing protein [Dietzia sp. B32]|uniref:Mur ligase domain-containing protein n=1 Tax=Dietzia sp. B32 TaxID=2915130 RepID=UPI0021AE1E6D|nr:Mur ligase domain-containing protein [Dietzia sp. B32]UVE93924.1 Mur ligase domain-containing protein [Dietzia sp. B32]